MDFSPTSLFTSLLIGSIGLGLFIYGKKQQRMPQLIAGISLSVYPYFVGSVGWMIGIGMAVLVGLACALRAGF